MRCLLLPASPCGCLLHTIVFFTFFSPVLFPLFSLFVYCRTHIFAPNLFVIICLFILLCSSVHSVHHHHVVHHHVCTTAIGDEATSALDSNTEAGILRSLDALAQGRTSVFVAHRLSTIQHCDVIYVLQDGVVCEHGTHSDLLAEGGMYADMWRVQLSAEAGRLASHRVVGEQGDMEEESTEEDEQRVGAWTNSVSAR